MNRPYLFVADEYVRPVIIWPNQSRPNRILPNVFEFLRFTFVMAQSVIEKVSLPFDFSLSRRNPFEVTDEFRKFCIRRNADEKVQMVRHQQEQFKIPLFQLMIPTRSFEKYLRDLILAKLVHASRITANRNEIGCSEPPVKMNRMIQHFAHGPSRNSVLIHFWGNRAIGVNCPYLELHLLAALFFDEVAQLALHRLERVVNDLVERLVRAVVHLFFVAHQLVTRSHRDIDPATIRITFVMSMVRLLDRDIASVDVVAEFLEARSVI